MTWHDLLSPLASKISWINCWIKMVMFVMIFYDLIIYWDLQKQSLVISRCEAQWVPIWGTPRLSYLIGLIIKKNITRLIWLSWMAWSSLYILHCHKLIWVGLILTIIMEYLSLVNYILKDHFHHIYKLISTTD